MYVVIALGLALGASGGSLLFGGDLGGVCLFVPAVMIFVAGILGLRDSKPRVTITSQGIKAREVGPDLIPWHEIESARLEELPRAGTLIVLKMVSGKKERFYVGALEATPHEILHQIQDHLDADGQ